MQLVAKQIMINFGLFLVWLTGWC